MYLSKSKRKDAMAIYGHENAIEKNHCQVGPDTWIYLFEDNNKKYRYIKFVSNPKRRSPIMEMEFYDDGKLLRGKPFANGALIPENCFDGDTYNTMKNIERGYSVGCDFGKPVAVDKIILYLRNDGNYVVPGDEYELSYYDKGRWVYTRAYKSKGHKLVYKNVPSGALYVLRNRTKGSEERIFTYENGKQVWW